MEFFFCDPLILVYVSLDHNVHREPAPAKIALGQVAQSSSGSSVFEDISRFRSVELALNRSGPLIDQFPDAGGLETKRGGIPSLVSGLNGGLIPLKCIPNSFFQFIKFLHQLLP